MNAKQYCELGNEVTEPLHIENETKSAKCESLSVCRLQCTNSTKIIIEATKNTSDAVPQELINYLLCKITHVETEMPWCTSQEINSWMLVQLRDRAFTGQVLTIMKVHYIIHVLLWRGTSVFTDALAKNGLDILDPIKVLAFISSSVQENADASRVKEMLGFAISSESKHKLHATKNTTTTTTNNNNNDNNAITSQHVSKNLTHCCSLNTNVKVKNELALRSAHDKNIKIVQQYESVNSIDDDNNNNEDDDCKLNNTHAHETSEICKSKEVDDEHSLTSTLIEKTRAHFFNYLAYLTSLYEYKCEYGNIVDLANNRLAGDAHLKIGNLEQLRAMSSATLELIKSTAADDPSYIANCEITLSLIKRRVADVLVLYNIAADLLVRTLAEVYDCTHIVLRPKLNAETPPVVNSNANYEELKCNTTNDSNINSNKGDDDDDDDDDSTGKKVNNDSYLKASLNEDCKRSSENLCRIETNKTTFHAPILTYSILSFDKLKGIDAHILREVYRLFYSWYQALFQFDRAARMAQEYFASLQTCTGKKVRASQQIQCISANSLHNIRATLETISFKSNMLLCNKTNNANDTASKRAVPSLQLKTKKLQEKCKTLNFDVQDDKLSMFHATTAIHSSDNSVIDTTHIDQENCANYNELSSTVCLTEKVSINASSINTSLEEFFSREDALLLQNAFMQQIDALRDLPLSVDGFLILSLLQEHITASVQANKIKLSNEVNNKSPNTQLKLEKNVLAVDDDDNNKLQSSLEHNKIDTFVSNESNNSNILNSDNGLTSSSLETTATDANSASDNTLRQLHLEKNASDDKYEVGHACLSAKGEKLHIMEFDEMTCNNSLLSREQRNASFAITSGNEVKKNVVNVHDDKDSSNVDSTEKNSNNSARSNFDVSKIKYMEDEKQELVQTNTFILRRSIHYNAKRNNSEVEFDKKNSASEIEVIDVTSELDERADAIQTLLQEDDTVVICNERCSCNAMKLVDRFQVLRENRLGSGSYGTVYRAWDEQMGCYLAAKEVAIDGPQGYGAAVREVLKEYNILTELNHRNIVRVVAFMVSNGVGQIFMEWMPSGSVQEVLSRNHKGILREAVISRYTHDALAGLMYLHSRGVLHRDVKPANMLLGVDGALKLTDFGSSSVLSNNRKTLESTAVTGTAPYMAPEAVQGTYSASSDIWALGCSVVEMATGVMPWTDLATGVRMDTIPLLYYIGSLNDTTNLERPHSYLKVLLRERNKTNNDDDKPDNTNVHNNSSSNNNIDHNTSEKYVTEHADNSKKDVDENVDNTVVMKPSSLEGKRSTCLQYESSECNSNSLKAIVNFDKQTTMSVQTKLSTEVDRTCCSKESSMLNSITLNASSEMIDFLDIIFAADRKKRPSAQELLSHPFITKYENVWKMLTTPKEDEERLREKINGKM